MQMRLAFSPSRPLDPKRDMGDLEMAGNRVVHRGQDLAVQRLLINHHDVRAQQNGYSGDVDGQSGKIHSARVKFRAGPTGRKPDAMDAPSETARSIGQDDAGPRLGPHGEHFRVEVLLRRGRSQLPLNAEDLG